MSRWIRLDIDFQLSQWVTPLSSEAKLAWVMLLCHSKANGVAGISRSLDAPTAARLWFMGEESVRQMLLAAQNGGALAVQGREWIVLNWPKYQGDETAAERQRRLRDKRKSVQNVTDVTRDNAQVDSNGHGSHALVTDVTRTLTETLTETETTNVVSRPRRERFVPPTAQEVESYMRERGWANPQKRAEQFIAHYEANGWRRGKGEGIKIRDWKACVRTWEDKAKSSEHAAWGQM